MKLYIMKKNNDLYKPVLIITSLFFASQLNAQSLPDSKIKTNSSPIENPVEKVKQLEPLTYEYKTTEYKSLKLPAGKQYGFLADNTLFLHRAIHQPC